MSAEHIIIRGPLGCGKSTISELLAEKLGGVHIAVDRVLDEHNLTDDKEDGYISQASFKKANEIITPKAQKFLEDGTPVIFDGNFYWQSQIEDLISRLDYPYKVFTLVAPVDVCITRDSERKKTHGKDAAGAVYEKSTSFTYGEEIDATGTAEETLKQILDKLNIPR